MNEDKNDVIEETGPAPEELREDVPQEKEEKKPDKKEDRKDRKAGRRKDEERAALEAEKEALEKEKASLNDKYLRLCAEYDNFRRRSQKEKEAIYGDSKAEIIGKLLPVIDNFERASAAEADPENYKKGIEMTVRQLLDALTAMGVEAYGAAGDPFDPNIHNGVMHVDDDSMEENVVADVFIKGYKMGDKVIRHASVKVAN